MIDLVSQPQVEQPVLLGDQERVLPLELGALRLRLRLLIARLRDQHGTEPIPHGGVLDLHGVEDRQDLPFDLRLRNAVARVTVGEVPAAPVIHVHLVARLAPLDDPFAGDGPSAVTAVHEAARVADLQRVVDVTTEQSLDPIPGSAIDQRFVLTGIGLALVVDLADVAAIPQNGVNRGPREARGAGAVDHALLAQPLDHAVDGEPLVGVQVEEPADVGGRDRIDDDRAASIGSDVAVPVGCAADEPAILDATSLSFTHIDGELLRVEARHVRQGPPHHPAGRIALGRLRDGDEREPVLAFEPLQFDVVEEVAGRPIDLVEEQPVQFQRVLLRVVDEFLEGLPFVGLARRLGDAEEPHDLPAGGFGIAAQRLLLHGQGEALTFLFT